MTRQRTDHPNRTAMRGAHRRGVAMLLVIVALGTGVVLAGAYMTSNDNVGSVGENAANTVKASWSAKSAADIGVAILETELDWRTAIADGELVSNESIAGGDVTIAFTNLQGDPPTADDAEVIMTVTSNVNGIESTSQKLVRLIPDANVEEAVDNIIDEFTVFAEEALEVDSTSSIGIWNASPEAHSSKIGKIGIGFTDGADLQISNSAGVAKTGVFAPSDANTSLRNAILSSAFAVGQRLPVKMPSPPMKMTNEFDGLTYVDSDVVYEFGNVVKLPAGFFKYVRMANNAVLQIDSAFGTHYAFKDIELDNGSTMEITGHVKIRVDDDFRIFDGSAVELMTADSSLEIWIADTLEVDDSTIGFSKAVAANESRSRDDAFKYRSPSSIRIYVVYDDGSFDDSEDIPGQYIIIEDNALVSANIYAPFSNVDISNGGTVFGRVSGRRMRLSDNGAILGDPALDKGIGLTEKYGPLYKENGDPIDGLADALAAVNEADGWDSVKVSLTSTVESALDLVGGLLGGGKEAEPAPTERKRGRAIAREWPLKALAMEIKEKKEEVKDEPDGSFLVAKADDDDDDDDDD